MQQSTQKALYFGELTRQGKGPALFIRADCSPEVLLEMSKQHTES